LGNEEPGGIALSPDGERLAMLSINRRVLSVMPSEGGKPRVIHRFDRSRNTNPEWTRDGRYVLIGSGDIGKGILYRIAVEDGQIQEINLLTSPESSARRAIWDRISLHPDGRRIALTTQFNTDSDADVWVMQNFLPESAPKK
jgi:Tol biopolymer transport system component